MDSSSQNTQYQGTIAVALTGASGMQYGIRLIECLLKARYRVWLMYTKAAQIVARQELNWTLPTQTAEATLFLSQNLYFEPGQLEVFAQDQWFAPPASGTGAPDAMVIIPCTMGSLASIAAGLSQNLIERAADVMIKENKKLILVPRETPFLLFHLENMLKVARMNVCILPPNPGFYHHPQTLDDLIDFVVARVLDQLNISQALMPRWGGDTPL